MKHQGSTLQLRILAWGRNIQPGYGRGEAEMTWKTRSPGNTMSWLLPPWLAAYDSPWVPMRVSGYIEFYLTDVICSFADSLLCYLWFKKGGEAVGKKWLFALSWLLHFRSSRASQKEGEIGMCCGREVLWSPTLTCWSSDPPGNQVNDQEQPKPNKCELVAFGQLSSPNCEAGWVLVPRWRRGWERSSTDLDWLRSAKDCSLRDPPWEEGMGAGSQPSFRGYRGGMFVQGSTWNLLI